MRVVNQCENLDTIYIQPMTWNIKSNTSSICCLPISEVVWIGNNCPTTDRISVFMSCHYSMIKPQSMATNVWRTDYQVYNNYNNTEYSCTGCYDIILSFIRPLCWFSEGSEVTIACQWYFIYYFNGILTESPSVKVIIDFRNLQKIDNVKVQK